MGLQRGVEGCMALVRGVQPYRKHGHLPLTTRTSGPSRLPLPLQSPAAATWRCLGWPWKRCRTAGGRTRAGARPTAAATATCLPTVPSSPRGALAGHKLAGLLGSGVWGGCATDCQGGADMRTLGVEGRVGAGALPVLIVALCLSAKPPSVCPPLAAGCPLRRSRTFCGRPAWRRHRRRSCASATTCTCPNGAARADADPASSTEQPCAAAENNRHAALETRCGGRLAPTFSTMR